MKNVSYLKTIQNLTVSKKLIRLFHCFSILGTIVISTQKIKSVLLDPNSISLKLTFIAVTEIQSAKVSNSMTSAPETQNATLECFVMKVGTASRKLIRANVVHLMSLVVVMVCVYFLQLSLFMASARTSCHFLIQLWYFLSTHLMQLLPHMYTRMTLKNCVELGT